MNHPQSLKHLTGVGAALMALVITGCASTPVPASKPAQADSLADRVVERDLGKGGLVLPNPERP